MADITGTPNGEYLNGTSGNDVILGLGGDDALYGRGGSDRLDGGEGNDYLSDDDGGDDVLLGGAGNDQLNVERGSSGGVGTVLLDGGVGDDGFWVQNRHATSVLKATVLGGDGQDRLSVLQLVDITADLGSGDDTINFWGASKASFTLGSGVDRLKFIGPQSIVMTNAAPVVVTDFQVGDTGDVLDFDLMLEGYDTVFGYERDNPFATGFLRVVQDGTDTLIQIDRDATGNAYAFATIVRLNGVTASQLTDANFAGWSPTGTPRQGQTFVGGAANDSITGTRGADVITGGAGNDSLSGGAGDDVIEGGDGHDSLDGSYGVDRLYGQGGNDSLHLRGGGSAWGGDGADSFVDLGLVVGRTASLFGEDGDDRFVVRGVAGRETIADGGAGDDSFELETDGGVVLNGGAGDDTILLRKADRLTVSLGEGGSDAVVVLRTAAPSQPVVVNDFEAGWEGDVLDLLDLLRGKTNWNETNNPFSDGVVRLETRGSDTIVQVKIGGAWSDFVVLANVQASALRAHNFAGYGPDGSREAGRVLVGEYGLDRLTGGAGDDTIYGRESKDVLSGGAGDDVIYGGSDHDTLEGGFGNDVLVGGFGDDLLRGGAGADTYVYEYNGLFDIIETFTVEDTILIRDYGKYFSAVQDGVNVVVKLTESDASITIRNANLADVLSRLVFEAPKPIPPVPAYETPSGPAATQTAVVSTPTVQAAGTTAYSTAQQAFYVYAGQPVSPMTFRNEGSIVQIADSRNSTDGLFWHSMNSNDKFTNATGATAVFVTTGDRAQIYGIRNLSGSVAFENDGVFKVLSVSGSANGLYTGGDGYFRNTGQFLVHGLNSGFGMYLLNGTNFYNSGEILVTGKTAGAVSISNDVESFLNTGTIKAVDSADWSRSGGLMIDVQTDFLIRNTGTIEAEDAIRTDTYVTRLVIGTIENSGVLKGDVRMETGGKILNSGSILGEVHIARQAYYDNREGRQSGGGVYTGVDDDKIWGGVDGEFFFTGSGADTVLAGGGDDFVDGGYGADVLDGGDGFDTVSYETAVQGMVIDLAAGRATGTRVDTLSGFEAVLGGRFADTIVGDSGANRIEGAGGNDLLTGGEGGDVFVFSAGDGDDTILDFKVGEDVLELVGLANYLELKQSGNDVLVVLSEFDVLTLKNVSAADLTSASFRFNAPDGALGRPPAPASIGEVPIFVWGDVRIEVGETLSFVDQSYAVIGRTVVNAGTVLTESWSESRWVSAFAGNDMGFFREELLRFENEATGVVRVVTHGPKALALGGDAQVWINRGLFETIGEAGPACITGTFLMPEVHNSGTFRSTSPDLAIGFRFFNGFSAFENDGLIEVLSQREAVAVQVRYQYGATPLVNNGTIRAVADGVENTTSGYYVDSYAITYDSMPGLSLEVVNTGLIEAEYAFAQKPMSNHLNRDYTVQKITNAGEIRGIWLLEGGNDIVANTGLVTGQIRLGEGDDVYEGATGTQQGGVLGGDGNDRIIAGLGGDVLNGEAGNDHLAGGVGVDELTGGAGDDYLDGGAEADVLIGGAGSDTYVVDSLEDQLVEAADGGRDAVVASISYVLADAFEVLSLSGSENLNATGNASANELIGNSGANWLDGRAGADTMKGGAGDDTYMVDSTQDAVIEAAGEGFDTVFASASHTLTANVERGILTSAGALVGNGLGNLMGGSTGADLLDGGAGADRMEGWLGDDTYIIDHVNDWVFEAAGQGFDSVFSSVSWVMKDNIERAFLTVGGLTLTGNSTANIMGGSTGDDILNGAGGADLMEGWLGDDIYFVDNTLDRVVEAADQGFDSVYASFNYTLGANIERGFLTVGGFRLNGNGTANVLGGSTGADILDGGLGADLMEGWLGDDIYFVDNTLDRVVEAADQGFDTVYASFNYTLGANIERGYLSVGGFRLNGNATGNVLGGSTGNDILDGGLGADLMEGWLGDDTYFVDSAADVVIEHANQGFDTVYTAVSLTLGANFERGYLTTGGRTLTGNATGNVLGGSQGDDVLIGGGGADLLEGWTGVDTFRYLAASDSTTAARDVLGDFQVGVDKIDLTAIRTGGSDTFAFEASGANTILNVDLGGDGSIDMSIFVRNATITASDLLWDPAPALVGEPQVMTAPPAEALDVTTEVLGGPGDLFDFGAVVEDVLVGPQAPVVVDTDPLVFVPVRESDPFEPNEAGGAPNVLWDAENGWIVLNDAPSARGWNW